MPIEFQVNSLDQVSEDVRGAYDETESGFVLNPDKYAEAKAAGLKAKNKELLGFKKQTQEQLSRFEKFKDVADEDWDAFQSFKEAKANGADHTNGEHGKVGDSKIEELQAKWQRDRAESDRRLKDNHAREIAQWKQQLEASEQKYKTHVREEGIRRIAANSGVNPKAIDAFLKANLDRFALDESNKLVFLDKDGDPSDLSPEKAVMEKLREDQPWFWPASQAGGSGATPNHYTPRGLDLEKMSPAQKIEFGLQQQQRR